MLLYKMTGRNCKEPGTNFQFYKFPNTANVYDAGGAGDVEHSMCSLALMTI